MSKLQGRAAIVTGAARGIGAACAESLAREGASVMLTDVLEAEVRQTAKALQAQGFNTAAMTHDVTNGKQWEAVMDATQQAFGRIDILVNNAGINNPGTIETYTVEQFRAVLEVNLVGTFQGIQAAIKRMKSIGGAIVNIASNSTRAVVPMTTAYSPSKAGVANLTKVAALHCAAEGYNIRVNSVHPGPTETPMMTGGGTMRAVDIPEVRRLIEAIPLRRMAQPKEIGDVVAFLASDAASYVTGEEIFVDAGVTVTLGK